MMHRSAFLTFSAALGAAAAIPQRIGAQAAPLPLRVAATANDTFSSAYYALDEGFFSRNGLVVDLQTMQNGAAIAAGIVGGAVDIGVATPVTLAIANLRGLPFVILAAGSLSSSKNPALVLCVKKTSSIKAPKDLVGKTIALNGLGVGLDLALDAWLANGGADPKSVKFVEVRFSEMGAALDRGTVDAAEFTEPALTVALKQNNIQIIGDVDAAVAPQFLNSCWFTTRQWADAHPEQVKRFVRAIYDTQRWANGHGNETAAILSKYSNMDVALIRVMRRSPWADQLRASDVQPFLDVAAKYGGLARPVDATSLFYQSAQ
jgi:NitT/TauT family transport system substrate-binding protein